MIEIPVPIHLANKSIELAAERLRDYGLDPHQIIEIDDSSMSGTVIIKLHF